MCIDLHHAIVGRPGDRIESKHHLKKRRAPRAQIRLQCAHQFLERDVAVLVSIESGSTNLPQKLAESSNRQ